MPSTSEISRGVAGALKFLQRDPTAGQHFDNTREACLRSFQTMILAAPLYALYLALHYMRVGTQADDVEIVLIEALHYVVDWLLFPVLFYEIARRRAWLDRFPRYISALNWINVPAIALMVASSVVSMLAPAVGQGLEFALQVVLFYWFLTATRMLVGVGWPFAFLLLIVNWVPSFFLSLLVDRILGVTGAG